MKGRYLTSRRTFLLSSLSLGAALLGAACGGTASTPTAAPPRTAAPASPPATATSAAPTAPATAVSSPTPAAQTTSAAQPLSFTWANWVLGPVDADNDGVKLLKQQLNVDVKLIALERDTYRDQLNTRIAGGDIPDVIQITYADQLQSYSQQGILVEVPFATARQFARNYFEAVNQFSIDAWLASNQGGKNWGLPLMEPSQTHPFTNGWRKDWLDAVGITGIPQTIEEHEEAFAKFVEKDPPGNGKGHTFGLTLEGKDWADAMASAFYGAYGVFPNMWMALSETEVQHGITMDGARRALTTLQSWYKKGLIDPEFVSTDSPGMTDAWVRGKVGYTDNCTWYRLIKGGEFYDKLMAVNPKAQIAFADAPKGPDGKFGYFNWGYVTAAVTFGKSLQGDKLGQVLAVLDKIASSVDLATALHWGKEGVHWKRDPDTNAVLFIPPYDKPEARSSLGTNFFAVVDPIPAVQATWDRKDLPQLVAKAEAGNVKNFVTWINRVIPSDVAKQASQLTPIAQKWIVSFISGTKSMDQWGAFLNEWNNAGGKAVTQAANEGYRRMSEIRNSLKKMAT